LVSGSNPANVFASVGDGPKVTVSVTAAKKTNTQVSVAFPAGSGKFDIIARVTDMNNNAVANLRDITATGQLNNLAEWRTRSYEFFRQPGTARILWWILWRDSLKMS
jgi:hypothetical protein